MPCVLWYQALRTNYLCEKGQLSISFLGRVSFVFYYILFGVCVVHGVHVEVKKQLVRNGSV